MNIRRLSVSVVVAAVAVLAACDDEPGGRPAGSTPAGGAAGCPAVAPGTATVEVIPGPSNGLPRATAPGESLVIEAVVLDSACRPAVGANVHLWHTDATGRYGPTAGSECCYYDGTVTTDDAGRFRLRSVRPAQYPVPDAPPAHIHLEISHRGDALETEIVFGDDPPPSLAPPTGQVLPIVLSRDGDGWRGEALMVLHTR